jgi:AcrR family transcriptional regulator
MSVAERRQALRERLVAAAEERIARDGLSGLKARDLAADAGCALGAIYTAFPDLDALILEVNLRTLALFEAAIGAGPPPGDDAAEDLVRLALAYLAFARAQSGRWLALFQHRMAGGRPPPEDYLREQGRLFSLVEAPLARLRPDLAPERRRLLARTLFSATHGIVSLGLDEKLQTLPRGALEAELAGLVRAMAQGLADQAGGA